jgi:hypothetical protein
MIMRNMIVMLLTKKYDYKEEEEGEEDVGTLPKGYVRNVPLPRVPLRQSAPAHQVHTVPDYYDNPYGVPMYGIPRSIVERAAYAFSPARHAIAINT